MSQDGTWRCPGCGAEVVIKGRKLTLKVKAAANSMFAWPRHPDCQLAKVDIDHLDYSKLEKVG